MKAKKRKQLCPFCNKYFTNLSIHERIHTGEKQYSCEVGVGGLGIFRREIELNQTPVNPYWRETFEICLEKFFYLMSWRRHSRTHTGEKPSSCEICHKKFGSKWSWQCHSKIHSGIKTYICEICGKLCIGSDK